jgi:ABC-2 type transport system permease protein
MDPIKRLIRKATLSYKGLFAVMSLSQYLMVNLGSPLMQMLCFTLVARYVNKGVDVSYWLIGNALVLTYFNAIFGVGSQLTQEKNSGTLKLLVASPSSGVSIFLPRATLHILDGLVTVVVGLAVGALLFGFRIPLSVWPAFMLVLIVASFSAMAFGLIISCFGLLTRDLNMILNVASMAMLGLTGANFPLNRMPVWLQPIGSAMPLTRSIEASRALYAGAPFSEISGMLMGEIGLGIVLMLIGTLLFNVMTRVAIKQGVLEMF